MGSEAQTVGKSATDVVPEEKTRHFDNRTSTRAVWFDSPSVQFTAHSLQSRCPQEAQMRLVVSLRKARAVSSTSGIEEIDERLQLAIGGKWRWARRSMI